MKLSTALAAFLATESARGFTASSLTHRRRISTTKRWGILDEINSNSFDLTSSTKKQERSGGDLSEAYEMMLAELVFSTNDPRVDIVNKFELVTEPAFLTWLEAKIEASKDPEERLALRDLLETIEDVKRKVEVSKLAEDRARQEAEEAELQRMANAEAQAEAGRAMSTTDILKKAAAIETQSSEAQVEALKEKRSFYEEELTPEIRMSYEGLLQKVLPPYKAGENPASVIYNFYDQFDAQFVKVLTERATNGDPDAQALLEALAVEQQKRIADAAETLKSILALGDPMRMEGAIVRLAREGKINEPLLLLLEANETQAKDAGVLGAAQLMARLRKRAIEEKDKQTQSKEIRLLRQLLRTDDALEREKLLEDAFTPKDTLIVPGTAENARKAVDGELPEQEKPMPEVPPPDFINACKAVLLNFGNLGSDDNVKGDLATRIKKLASEAEVVATRIYGKGMTVKEQQDRMWAEQTTSIFDLERMEIEAERNGEHAPWTNPSADDDMFLPGFDSKGRMQVICRDARPHSNGSTMVTKLRLLGFLLVIGLADGAKIKRVKEGKKYQLHDAVHIVVNKVGNPTETYRYYSLPFCHQHSTEEEEKLAAEEENVNIERLEQEKRQGALRHKLRMGESFVGDRRESSPYEITFLDSVDWRLLCQINLDTEQLNKFKEAIHNSYFFEMFVEDLPMWGYVGDAPDEDFLMGSKTFLFPHLQFHLGYNKDMQIVSARLTTDMDRRVDITKTDQPISVKFSYSAQWYPEDLAWKDRLSKYAESRFLPSSFEIHWLSIINSFVLVLLLTAFLTIILLRVLKNDFSRYMELDDDALEEEESGWKLIHGDVFRFPENVTLFSAAVGTGNQLIALTLVHLTLALMGVISTTRRGSIMAGVVVLYCLTSFIGGYTAVRLYHQLNGKNWVHCVLWTAGLFPGPVTAVFMWVNSVAIAHGSTSALPFTAILTVIALYLFISFPLTVLGGITAKNHANKDFNAPTRTTKVAREIPTEIPWYRGRAFQVLIAGFLPFSAIYIELHYIFASMWGHQIYTLFGILFLAFILLVTVTSFITVALLYFQLAREDHRWWWATYVNGGMTGLFIYIYSFYFYFRRSGMSGVLQGSFYFGYMAIVSFAFFLMLGSAGFQFSLVFVKYIYSRIKSD